MRTCLVFAVVLAGCAAPSSAPPPCDAALSLVKERAVGLDAPGLHTVRSLLRAIRARDLFVRVDRRIMARWHQEPAARATWLDRLHRTEARVEELRDFARERLLSGEEAANLTRADELYPTCVERESGSSPTHYRLMKSRMRNLLYQGWSEELAVHIPRYETDRKCPPPDPGEPEKKPRRRAGRKQQYTLKEQYTHEVQYESESEGERRKKDKRQQDKRKEKDNLDEENKT